MRAYVLVPGAGPAGPRKRDRLRPLRFQSYTDKRVWPRARPRRRRRGVRAHNRRVDTMGKWIGIGIVVLLLAAGAAGVSTYNSLVTLDQSVQAQWAQVENVYQRRADLVPNLVETVKGAAAFEKETF